MLGMQHGHNILEHERLIRGSSSSLEQIAEPAYVPPESAAVIGGTSMRDRMPRRQQWRCASKVQRPLTSSCSLIWYLVATDDRMIPPEAQRAMAKRAGATVEEAKGSHAIYVSKPRAVADLIDKAANA